MRNYRAKAIAPSYRRYVEGNSYIMRVSFYLYKYTKAIKRRETWITRVQE